MLDRERNEEGTNGWLKQHLAKISMTMKTSGTETGNPHLTTYHQNIGINPMEKKTGLAPK